MTKCSDAFAKMLLLCNMCNFGCLWDEIFNIVQMLSQLTISFIHSGFFFLVFGLNFGYYSLSWCCLCSFELNNSAALVVCGTHCVLNLKVFLASNCFWIRKHVRLSSSMDFRRTCSVSKTSHLANFCTFIIRTNAKQSDNRIFN